MCHEWRRKRRAALLCKAPPNDSARMYVTKLNRPSELRTIRDGEGRTPFEALTPAVDAWSFGCGLFRQRQASPHAATTHFAEQLWALGVKSTRSWSWQDMQDGLPVHGRCFGWLAPTLGKKPYLLLSIQIMTAGLVPVLLA